MGNASSKSNEKNPQPIKFNRINTFDKNDQEEKEEVFGTLEERQKKHLEMINLAKDAFQQGNTLFRASKMTEAISKYTSAMTMLRHCDEKCACPEQLVVMTNLGVLKFGEGRYEEAKALLSQALFAFKTCHSEIKEECLTDLNIESLSIALRKDMMFHRLPDSQKILASILTEHSDIDALTSDLLNNLAACNEVLGNLEEAYLLYDESLKLRKIIYGDQSIKVAESMQNIATILDSQGKLREAGDLLTNALLIEEKIYGKNSIETTVGMNNLGVNLAHLGELELSEALLQRTYEIRCKAYGEFHHLSNCSKANLTYVKNKINSSEDKCRDFHANINSVVADQLKLFE